MKKVVVLTFLMVVSGTLGAMSQYREETLILGLATEFNVHSKFARPADNLYSVDSQCLKGIMDDEKLLLSKAFQATLGNRNQIILVIIDKSNKKQWKYTVSGNKYKKEIISPMFIKVNAA